MALLGLFMMMGALFMGNLLGPEWGCHGFASKASRLHPGRRQRSRDAGMDVAALRHRLSSNLHDAPLLQGCRGNLSLIMHVKMPFASHVTSSPPRSAAEYLTCISSQLQGMYIYHILNVRLLGNKKMHS